MSTVHTRYVTWISRGRRHHGSTSADLVSPLTGAVPEGGHYQAWASPEITYNADGSEQTAHFAFWSVVGGANGPFFTNTPSLDVQVGTSDVQATAWYVPLGGGRGEPGTTIDAFDVQVGDFVDDDFVAVTPDAELSSDANELGFVPSVAFEHVLAFDNIHAVPFKDWLIVLQSPANADSTAEEDLSAAQNSSAIAFAFYQRPARLPIGRVDVPAKSTWVSWGVMVDGGGPTGDGPVPPWGPLMLDIAAGLTMADSARLAHVDLRGAALELAAKQVELAAGRLAAAMREGAALKR